MNLLLIGYTWGSELVKAFKKLYPEGKLTLIYPHELDEELFAEEKLKELFLEAHGVVIDLRGGGKAEEIVYKNFSQGVFKDKIIITFLGSPRLFSLAQLGKFSMKKIFEKREAFQGFSEPISVWERIKRFQKLVQFLGKTLPFGVFKDAKNYVDALKYLSFPCEENYINFLKLLGSYWGYEFKEIKPPKEFPEYGIYHPNLGIFTNLDEYLNKLNVNDSNSITKIGTLFHGGIHFQQNLFLVKAICEKFSEFLLIPVYCNGIHNIQAIREFFFHKEKPFISSIIRLLWFRLNGGPFGGDPNLTYEVLKELNVPVFSPVVMYRREIEKWQESDYGLSMIEVVGAVIWPEMDGSIEPIPVAGLTELEKEGIKIKEVFPIEERLNKIKQRITSWINLKNKKNSEKRIAFIIYNYPPGEENLGKAAYLDVFKSVENLLKILKEKGYKVENLPEDLAKLFEELCITNSGKWFTNEALAKNCPRFQLKDWCSYLEKLPSRAYKELIESWGEAPGNVMVYKDSILIPCVEFGNVLVGVQPSRAPIDWEEAKKLAHDKTKPPHHQYVAFYKWLEEVLKADAIIHVGTHGLAEFTKGKEVGMSENCFPDILIGKVPHLYFYHVLNTSEATIAKRRLYGMLISYNSPPYTTSDLYEDYALLEEYLNEYEEAKDKDIPRANLIKAKIEELSKKLNLIGSEIEELHDELYRLKRSIIPKGLHVLGERYTKEEICDFMTLFLRFDREGCKSLNRILAEAMGYDYDKLLKDRKKFVKILDEIDRKAKEIIKSFLDRGNFLENLVVNARFKEELRKTLEYGKKIAEKFADNYLEIENFLKGLEVGYIDPSVGGDIIRTPDALPTGRNLYQFDPNKIPTEGAYLRGIQIAENTLRTYLKATGIYPESVGIILWGFETTQTQGETIGQILHYLGVKIERKYGSWYPELEIIPLEELGRPRIDCHIHICGFFREMFPNVMLLLDKAFNLVSELSEPKELNFVRKHSLQNLQILEEKKEFKQLDREKLKKIAFGRIFGPPPSEYGTRMLKLVEDSIWEKEEDLAEAFMQSMNYLYAENIHGLKVDLIYKENLKKIDLVSQVRSSHDYEFSDLDHYYEFFGGLSKSVEVEKGKKPLMLVSDTTQEVILTETVDRAIEHGLRTRLLNPKWIKEMLKHRVHGAQKIADIVENTLGWSATTGMIKNWIWEEIADRFCFNDEMRKQLVENNKLAALEVFQKLFEAYIRGYWQTKEERIEHLKKLILELEGIIEESAGGFDNERI